MSNLPTLADLAADPAQVTNLELDALAALLTQCDDERRIAEQAKKILSAHLRDRYAVQIANAYSAAEKDFGAVHAIVDGYDLEVDTAKKVAWDQEGLAKLEAQIRADGDDPAEYIKIERKVEEKAYGSWPAMLKKPFTPLRVVTPGSVSVKLTAVNPSELV
jgi:hypothetical protein